MITPKVFEHVLEHLHEVINQTPVGVDLLKQLIKAHPADIADFISNLDMIDAHSLFTLFSQDLRLNIFQELIHFKKVRLLTYLSPEDRNYIISHLSIDDLTDFFDELSDDELKEYLPILHKKDRERVLSLLKLNPESAGGSMHTNVLSLMQDFTVQKSIHILQRLQPTYELHRCIYVTSQQNELVGYINLEDLVLKSPNTRLKSIVRDVILIAYVNDDRETIAQKMVRYGVNSVPVVDEEQVFLGVISGEALVEIIEEEASEDIYRMSAVSPLEHTYFETPFLKLLFQRSSILIVLLIMQTFSSIIIEHYQILLCGFLTYFISMLTSTGGNASSQTSALVIQGLATGEINPGNSGHFIRREFSMALIIALLLGLFSFVRTYLTHHNAVGSFAVSSSLAVIVLVSITLGSTMPLLLKRLNIDPAHSAGPLLTTIIDVIGLLVYCLMSSAIFKLFS